MKRALLGLAALLVYGVAVVAVMGFHLEALVDWRWVGLVAGGSLLLTAPEWWGRTGEWRKTLARSLMLTGFTGAFLAVVASPATATGTDLARTFLPVFYAVLGLLALESWGPADRAAPGEAAKSSVDTLPLSRRELQVAKELLGSGSNKEIGTKLYIGEPTVKKHARQVYRKAGVRNRTELIRRFASASAEPGPGVDPVPTPAATK